MINLFFQGRVKQKAKLEEFACDVVNELLPREFKREIDIFVNFTKNIDAQGYCHVEDTDEIHIEVHNGYPTPIVASTLAHELVHAKQYIRGELNATMTKWLKQEIPKGPRGGIKIAYRQQPWEIEAFEREEELVEMLWT